MYSTATAAANGHLDRQRQRQQLPLLYANGSGQLDNSTAGYTVTVDGMASINVNGHAGDTAQFFDSPGNDTFYAYADYNNSGKPLAGMYGSGGYSNSASGFGTNIGYSTNGGSDTAAFFDSPGNDTFYAYADYNNSGQQLAGMYGSYGGGYSNSAKGFATNVGYLDQRRQRYGRLLRLAGQRHVLCLRGLQQQRPAVGGHVRQLRRRVFQLGQRLRHECRLLDQRRQRYGRLLRLAGQRHVLCLRELQQQRPRPLAGMYGSYGGGYSNSATGFGTNLGNSTNGGSDTADLFGSSGNDTLYTDLAIARFTGTNYSEQASGSRSSTRSAAGRREHQGPGPRELPVELSRQLGCSRHVLRKIGVRGRHGSSDADNGMKVEIALNGDQTFNVTV